MMWFDKYVRDRSIKEPYVGFMKEYVEDDPKHPWTTSETMYRKHVTDPSGSEEIDNIYKKWRKENAIGRDDFIKSTEKSVKASGGRTIGFFALSLLNSLLACTNESLGFFWAYNLTSSALMLYLMIGAYGTRIWTKEYLFLVKLKIDS